MPDIQADALVRFCRTERRVSPVSLATRAAVSLPIDPLWPSGDVLTVLCLGQG
jgi:hypothetical protein